MINDRYRKCETFLKTCREGHFEDVGFLGGRIIFK
jgi:hypothetical protein